MKQIINSILDTDLYKLSMMQFVIEHYPDAKGEYTFNNRDKSMIFNRKSIKIIKKQIKLMENLKLTDDEYDYLKEKVGYISVSARQYLAAYKFNSSQVNITHEENGELNIKIEGFWRDAILWEVPLMAIISEVYFKVMDKDWNMDGQVELINEKGKLLSDAGATFADFGTRRRRNFMTQDIVVRELCKYTGFVGTSNPFLAMKHGVKATGTCAHEAISGVAALESLNHPNKIFMKRWQETFQGDLGTMLPDTFGLESFLSDFSLQDAKLWDSVRHDSGDAHLFTDKIVENYKKLNINPMTKSIIFSNALDVYSAIELIEYCKNKILCSFGIGTHFTNDFKKESVTNLKSKPMNMVIKLTRMNGVPCVKLSDDPGKAIGDSKMVEIMKYIHFDIIKNNYEK